jgi:hypothetical protein
VPKTSQLSHPFFDVLSEVFFCSCVGMLPMQRSKRHEPNQEKQNKTIITNRSVKENQQQQKQYLLNASVTLNINLPTTINFNSNATNGIQGQFAHHIAPAADKLGADRGLDKIQHLLGVVHVDGDGDLVNNLDGILKSLLEGSNDDNRVNVALEVGQGLGKNLTGCFDSGRSRNTK